MKIRLRYFAIVRERLRRDEEELELADGATVAAALDTLCVREPALAALRSHLQVAVNQAVVTTDTRLAEGDELALLPPVAGGAGRLARLSSSELSLDEVVRAVAGAGRGGVVTFSGIVRGERDGRAVLRLEYEAYPAMAERVLGEIAEEVEREWPGARVAVVHRTGTLLPGELAVVIAAAAPHRAEAFAACRATIDRIKQRVPIWKKEVGENGAEWVGLTP